jgi:hypothetical protein
VQPGRATVKAQALAQDYADRYYYQFEFSGNKFNGVAADLKDYPYHRFKQSWNLIANTDGSKEAAIGNWSISISAYTTQIELRKRRSR